jgi:hypothetical protein
MLVLLVLAGAGCGNLTPGGFTGEATVVVSGDADTLSTAAHALGSNRSFLTPGPSAATAGGSGPARSADEAEGEIEVEFLAYLVNEAGGLLQLGDEEMRIRVDLRGRMEGDVVDRQPIPAVVYTEFRLIFTDIDAEVQGLVVNGVPVEEIHVELEDLSLLVSRPILLDVQPGARAELVVDLNSLAWLEAVDPMTGAVDETVFADLVNVVVR